MKHPLLPLCVMLLASAAWADKREVSLRPNAIYRVGSASAPHDEIEETAHMGGGLLIGYGLSFRWTLTARYEWTRTRPQNHPIDSQYRYLWIEQQHQGMLGLAWTLSDEYTPLINLEGGLTRHQTYGDHLFNGKSGDRRIGATPEITELAPTGRLTTAYEWRFSDYWSLAPGAFIGYDRGVTYGAVFTLAGYRYYNPAMLPDRPFDPRIFGPPATPPPPPPLGPPPRRAAARTAATSPSPY